MTAQIGIRDLPVQCVMGVEEVERRQEQRVEVDVTIRYDISRAAATDAIQHALDYSRVAALISEHLRWQKYHLLEAAAAGVIQMLENAYPFLEAIELEVRKPEILPGTAVSFITVNTAAGVDGNTTIGVPSTGIA